MKSAAEHQSLEYLLLLVTKHLKLHQCFRSEIRCSSVSGLLSGQWLGACLPMQRMGFDSWLGTRSHMPRSNKPDKSPCGTTKRDCAPQLTVPHTLQLTPSKKKFACCNKIPGSKIPCAAAKTTTQPK